MGSKVLKTVLWEIIASLFIAAALGGFHLVAGEAPAGELKNNESAGMGLVSHGRGGRGQVGHRGGRHAAAGMGHHQRPHYNRQNPGMHGQGAHGAPATQSPAVNSPETQPPSPQSPPVISNEPPSVR